MITSVCCSAHYSLQMRKNSVFKGEGELFRSLRTTFREAVCPVGLHLFPCFQTDQISMSSPEELRPRLVLHAFYRGTSK